MSGLCHEHVFLCLKHYSVWILLLRQQVSCCFHIRISAFAVQTCIWLFLITMVLLLNGYGVLNHAIFANVLVSKCHTWQGLKPFDRFALKPSSVKSSLACSLSILLFISVWYWPLMHSILCRKNQRMTPSLLKRSENCLSSMDGVHKTATFFFPSESVN